ncbi:MAG: ATP-dependent helicase, partial [Candidatus Eremiobacteraeota bacterium]|nr:ATP-dependent helicase [Candidatus Eremiobacteraeota bacterium]
MHVLRLCNRMRVQAISGGAAFRKLIALELTAAQCDAVGAPYDDCLALVGAAGTGKTTALVARIERARDVNPAAEPLVITPHVALETYAADVLNRHGYCVTLVDDVEAEQTFAEASAPLLALRWEEFAENQLDPEVPGLRSPSRFLQSAFRLIRRLRDASINPPQFLSDALTGATQFYANPPNLAAPALLFGTKASYHDSLGVSPNELARQHRREIDLAKILARLYERYLCTVDSTGRLTGRDAIAAATLYLRGDSTAAARLRARHRFAFVDDAQELTGAELLFLSAIFGERLAGVTLCGDPASAICSLRMTQPQMTFLRAKSRVELRQMHRTPRREVQRVSSPRDEAELIAERVGTWLAQGHRPDRIAVIFRSVACAEAYEAAMLDRDIPVVVTGDSNVFADRRALDALALLWNIHDPFRHDWLMRTLAGPAVGLSDASLATLCAEPPDPQRPLFAFDDEPAPTTRAGRWNPRRDLRLGWNVIRGDRDDALPAEAASRVRRFRRLREGWLEAMPQVSFERLARIVWRDGLARDGDPGTARARAQQVVLRRLLGGLSAFSCRNAAEAIADVLEHARLRRDTAPSECAVEVERCAGFVQMLSVEAARGQEYDYAIVAGVRPGA